MRDQNQGCWEKGEKKKKTLGKHREDELTNSVSGTAALTPKMPIAKKAALMSRIDRLRPNIYADFLE